MLWSVESNIKGYWIGLLSLPFRTKWGWGEPNISTEPDSLLEKTSFSVSSFTDAMQNHSIDQAVRMNCKILNSLSPTKSNASGGPGPNFLQCRHVQMAFRNPHSSTAVHKQGTYISNRHRVSDVRGEGTTQNRPAQTPHASDKDAETPEVKGLVQGQRVTNIPANTSTKFPNSPHTQTPFHSVERE